MNKEIAENIRIILGFVILTWVFCYGSMTLFRNAIYYSELSFWKQAVLDAPLSHRAWNNLGNVYAQGGGENWKAIEAHREAIDLEPHYQVAIKNLVQDYFAQGEIVKSMRYKRFFDDAGRIYYQWVIEFKEKG